MRGDIGSQEFSLEHEKRLKLKGLNSQREQREREQASQSKQTLDLKGLKELTIIEEAIDKGLTSLNPELMFNNLATNFQNAKRLYGPTLLRLVTGYNPEFIERNIKVPEFKKQLKKNIEETVRNLESLGLIDKEFSITEKAFEEVATLLLADLDFLSFKGFGEVSSKYESVYGDASLERLTRFKKRFKDLDVRATIRKVLKHGRTEITKKDLVFKKRYQRGGLNIVYCVDASGSMLGDKINAAKRAGLTLAFKAIMDKNFVSIIGFSSDVVVQTPLTNDFKLILETILKLKPRGKTSIATAIEKSVELLSNKKTGKHIIIITDAMPTSGEKPADQTLTAVSKAYDEGITVSVVGIELAPEAVSLAEKIVSIGSGRFLVAKANNLNELVIADYEFFKEGA